MSHNKNTNTSMVPSSVEAAAVEAALADGLISANGLYSSDEKTKKAGLRRGKWTSEEESYANRLIYEFKLGLLPLTEGTTLRTFLSKLLNCDPMRISKKFVGQNCIGKQVFRRRQQELEKLTPEQIEVQRRELGELERKFLERVATTNRSKSAAQPAQQAAKDGRAGFEEESSSGSTAVASVPPPWMVVPNPAPMTELSSVPADQLAGGASAAQFFLQQQQHQAFGGPSGSTSFPIQQHQQQQGSSHHYLPGGYASSLPAGFPPGIAPVPTHASYSTFKEDGAVDGTFLPRVTSLEMLNSIAQMGSSTGSLERLGAGDASALKQQQLQHLRMMHSYGGNASSGGGPGVGPAAAGGGRGSRSADPTPEVFPGLTLALAPNSSTLTLGDSVGWPSFGNLGSLGGGGSMDDLLSAGILSRQVSGGSPVDHLLLSSGSGSHKYLPKASSLAVDEGSVGYPLEDSNYGNSSGAQQAGTVGAGAGAALVRIQAPIVDMAAMSHSGDGSGARSGFPHDRHHGSGNRDHRDNGGGVRISGGEERLFGGNHVAQTEPSRLNGLAPSIPKNGSVEDFWMLVNMGDLPQPEQNVLSQMVWSPLERASAAAAAASASASAVTSAVASSSSTAAGLPAASAGASAGAAAVGIDDHGPLTMSPLPLPRTHQQHLPQPPAASALLLPPPAAASGVTTHAGADSSSSSSQRHGQKPGNGKRPEDASIKMEGEGERELKRPKLEPAA